jgi:hypothetical protein
VIVAEGLPRPLVGPTRQPLRSAPLRRGYLFAQVTHTNHEEILDIVDRAKLPVLLAIDPLRSGLYNTPKNFANISEFYQDLDKFRAKDIGIGIHCFACRVWQG